MQRLLKVMRALHRPPLTEKAQLQGHLWVWILLDVHCSQFTISVSRAEKRQKENLGPSLSLNMFEGD